MGGAGGAVRICEMAGVASCITFDMGGTSTDVSLIHELTPRISHANQIDAYPLQVPQLDIHTIGAGGGSIAWIREDGTLEVGPQSAGAIPGPACYGRGGAEATISDANLILGRLPGDRALAGDLRLSKALAEDAFRRLADALDAGDVVRLADGVLGVAVAKMAGAVREVSVHRGFDPRDFCLLGFGGAGPMHVFLVAEELAIPRVLIPRYPGHLSALGQLLADLRRDFVRVWGGRLAALDIADFRAEADAMRSQARALLEGDGFVPDRHRHDFSVDMRYVGQSYTLASPATRRPWSSPSSGPRSAPATRGPSATTTPRRTRKSSTSGWSRAASPTGPRSPSARSAGAIRCSNGARSGSTRAGSTARSTTAPRCRPATPWRGRRSSRRRAGPR